MVKQVFPITFQRPADSPIRDFRPAYETAKSAHPSNRAPEVEDEPLPEDYDLGDEPESGGEPDSVDPKASEIALPS